MRLVTRMFASRGAKAWEQWHPRVPSVHSAVCDRVHVRFKGSKGVGTMQCNGIPSVNFCRKRAPYCCGGGGYDGGVGPPTPTPSAPPAPPAGAAVPASASIALVGTPVLATAMATAGRWFPLPPLPARSVRSPAISAAFLSTSALAVLYLRTAELGLGNAIAGKERGGSRC
jgi:hypothetical protein